MKAPLTDATYFYDIDSFDYHQIDKDLDLLIKKRQNSSLKKLSTAQVKRYQQAVFSLYEHVKSLYRKFPEEFGFLYAKALSAMLGGRIDPRYLMLDERTRFRNFIEKNRLQYKFLALRLHFEVDEDGEPIVPIVKDGRTFHVSWADLVKEPCRGGLRFSIHGSELFTAGPLCQLGDEYTVTFRGIEKHNAESSSTLIEYDQVDPSEWGGGYLLEVWTVLKDGKNQTPTMGVGDHCNIILKDANGYVYSIGKFFKGNNLRFRDYFSLFSRKRGRMLSPDLFVYYMDGPRDIERRQIRISQTDFQRIFAVLSKKRMDKEPVFSLLKNNCVNFVQEVLEEGLGLRVVAQTPIVNYLLRVILPTPLIARSRRMLERMPHWFRRAFYYFPPYYAIVMGVTLALKLVEWKNSKGVRGSDLSLSDMFLKPWKIAVFHPLALREGLNASKSSKISLKFV